MRKLAKLAVNTSVSFTGNDRSEDIDYILIEDIEANGNPLFVEALNFIALKRGKYYQIPESLQRKPTENFPRAYYEALNDCTGVEKRLANQLKALYKKTFPGLK